MATLPELTLTTEPLSTWQIYIVNADGSAEFKTTLASVLSSAYGTNGTGAIVRATSPTLATPTLGVATATSINKVTIAPPTTSATLTLADGVTLSVPSNATLSGTNTGDQTITLTGNVTGSGTGSFATTIANSVVTNAMLAGNIAYSKLSLTGAILNADLAGSIALSKLSITGTPDGTKFLKDDGSWDVPSGGGGVTGLTSDGTVVTYTRNSIGTTSADGFVVTNTTAASAGAQQYSPRTVWSGRGWKTNATAASQSVNFAAEVRPVEGAASPTGALHFLSDINGAGFSSVASVSNTGLASFKALTNASHLGTSGAPVRVINYLRPAGDYPTFAMDDDGYGTATMTLGVNGGAIGVYNGPLTVGASGGYLTLSGPTISIAGPVTATGAANIPLTVQGAASQSASLTEWERSGGELVSSIGPTGNIVVDTQYGYFHGHQGNTWGAGTFLSWTPGAGNRFSVSSDGNGYGVVSVTSAENMFTFKGGVSRNNGGFGIQITADGLTHPLLVNSQHADAVALTVKGFTSQAGNLQEWTTVTPTVLLAVTADGHFALNTSAGVKIGTATGQKLGFWNVTPVVQQVLATGGGATVDNVISLLQTLGLCKQS